MFRSHGPARRFCLALIMLAVAGLSVPPAPGSATTLSESHQASGVSSFGP